MPELAVPLQILKCTILLMFLVSFLWIQKVFQQVPLHLRRPNIREAVDVMTMLLTNQNKMFFVCWTVVTWEDVLEVQGYTMGFTPSQAVVFSLSICRPPQLFLPGPLLPCCKFSELPVLPEVLRNQITAYVAPTILDFICSFTFFCYQI
jgi:hypothetical protein